jgi:hypothetical protein
MFLRHVYLEGGINNIVYCTMHRKSAEAASQFAYMAEKYLTL